MKTQPLEFTPWQSFGTYPWQAYMPHDLAPGPQRNAPSSSRPTALCLGMPYAIETAVS